MALRDKFPRLEPAGVVGASMRHAGVHEIANINAFGVMGITDVLRRIGDLRMLEAKLLAWIDRWEPRFAVLIDNPGFHLRFAEQLKLRGVPVFQYVAPKIWAWGAGRAPQLRENFTQVLGILPFEEDFYRDRQIPFTYVGSPLKDRIDKVMIRREALGLPAERPVIACLPGSRPAEVRLNLNTLIRIRAALASELPNALYIVPVAPNIDLGEITSALPMVADAHGETLRHHAPGDTLAVESWEAAGLRFVRGMSLEIMAVADAAVVASGTATLECALLGTPMVVVYTMSEMSYQIALRAVNLPYVSLVNLMAGKRLVEEFIQDFAIDDVASEVLSLLRDHPRTQAMRVAFLELRDQLKGMAAENAAAVIASRIGHGLTAAPG